MTTPLQKLAESMILEASLGFTDKKLKFLMYSAQQMFGVRTVAMTFDATKKAPKIVLTPEKADGSTFSKEEWEAFDEKWSLDKTSKNLLRFLGVTADVKIVFRRVVPKVKK